MKRTWFVLARVERRLRILVGGRISVLITDVGGDRGEGVYKEKSILA